MKRFIRHILFFSVLVILISIAFDSLIEGLNRYDYSWGCPLFGAKLADMEKKGGDFNTVFIGSSHTWRHINPMLFDSILQEKGMPSKSYNLGVHGMGNPENYYICEEFIEKNSNGIKKIFLTLDPIKNATSFLFQSRYTYCLTGEALPHVYHTILEEKYPPKTKLIRLITPTLNYLYKIFTAQKWRFTFIENAKDEQLKNINSFQRGFYSLDRAAIDDKMVIRRKETLKDSSFLTNKRRIAIRDFSQTFDKQEFLNTGHLNRIKDLMGKAKRKGIELSFIIHPLHKDYKEWIAMEEALPKGIVVELANPSVYSELYSYENFYDFDHYNLKGANYFTSYLANKVATFSDK